MRYALVLCAVVALSCFPPIEKRLTPAAVFRFDGATFRHCQLMLGWTELEMTEECGRPVARIGGIGDEQCWLYPSQARGLVDRAYSAAPYFVVCLTPVEDSNRSWQERRGTAAGVEKAPTHTMRVTGVYGLRTLSADGVTTPAPASTPVE